MDNHKHFNLVKMYIFRVINSLEQNKSNFFIQSAIYIKKRLQGNVPLLKT